MLNRWPVPADRPWRIWFLLFGVLAHLFLWFLIFLVIGLAKHVELFDGDNLVDLLITWIVLLLMAIGAALVFSAGEIDLSMSGCAVLGGAVLVAVGGKGELAPVLAVVLAAMLGFIVGCLNGALVAGLRVPSFVVTLGASLGLFAMAMRIGRSEEPFYGGGAAAAVVVGLLAFIVGTAAIAFAVLLAFWRQGQLEKRVALEVEEQPGADSPILPLVLRGVPFVFAATLAALAGVVLSLRVGGGPGRAFDFNLGTYAIAAALLGGALVFHGRGRMGVAVLGALGGAAVMALALDVLGSMGFASFTNDLVLGLVIGEACVVSGAVRLIEWYMDKRRAEQQAPPRHGAGDTAPEGIGPLPPEWPQSV